MIQRSAEQTLVLLERFCMGFDRGRGIWKQIDENRELLQFLFKEFPEIKERAPFVESWIEDTDFFLNCLVELLELKQAHPSPFFPRYWPGQLEDPKKYASTFIQKLEKPAS